MIQLLRGEAARIGAISNHAPSFELVFEPCVNLITLVRRFVSDFYSHVVEDEDTAGRLALATHELLENSAKYVSAGETALHIALDREAGAVLVRTRNRADPAQIALLQKTFDEIAAAPDSAQYFKTVLRRSALEPVGSGLGLARIRSEGEMVLRLVVRGDEVEIHARGSITGGIRS
ncbi:MAG: uncharacterized protein JWM74_4107 [Myxococcaceae bacterium]|nr:uncharacterized protein [Myxococcaceae bacterium]